MDEANKLPLLKESFKLLVEKLDKNDVVSIITCAGGDRIVADSVPGDQKRPLKRPIDNLSAGGGTGGAGALRSAYHLAAES